jgi:hypothetical protein
MSIYLKSTEVATDDVTIIRGRDISRVKFSKRELGQLALEVMAGRAIVNGLSIKQIARMFGLRASYLRTLLDGLHHQHDLLDTMLKLDDCEAPDAIHHGAQR